MNLGIVTYYDVTNYGAVLLAYAMQKYFENIGMKAEFLRYQRIKAEPTQLSILDRLRLMLPNARKAAAAEKNKRSAFADFRSQYLYVGQEYHYAKDLDALVIGSDQIFDCSHEFNDYQYGINAPCEKIVAYAPSFGEVGLTSLCDLPRMQEIQKALSTFYALSARDTNTRDIITELTKKEPTLVLDPVLLYGFKDEMKKWTERLVKEEYLVVYSWGGLTTTDEFKKAVCAFAKRNRLKTVSVGDRRPWCDVDYAAATPIEFFELIMHCSMVITNMFHGTCFSLLHNKPFYSIVMPHNENKLMGLLRDFSLEDQALYEVNSLYQMDIPKIDYQVTNQRINEKRSISMSYINRALSVE